ncbi:MAG: primosomal protein N' [Dethiobacter sp.]|nr:primosomal protein N' [Dethiobacter sp.]
MEIFVQIIVAIHSDAVDRPFTYRVPARLKLKVGSRVVVPFGGRRVAGYCVGLSPDALTGEIKEIEQVLDEEPLLTAELLALAEWGAGRFLCRRLDFLQAMVPAPARWTNRKWVVYTGRGEEEAPALAFLRAKGRLPLAQWLRQYPELKSARLLQRWRQSGIISVSDEERGGIRAKLERMVSLTEGGPAAGVTGYKQLLALTQLSERGPLSAGRLAALGIGPSTLRSLVQKGLVAITEVSVNRRPAGGCDASYASAPLLTAEQEHALTAIRAGMKGNAPCNILLHGVTGSGKTEVYLQAIEEVLAAGKGSIVLVPEISLTPQMIDRFTSRFGDWVAVLHSRLSAGERYDEWRRVASGEAMVVVGARSAVFAPLSELGLIVLDEEHEHSYKQEETPRYHARDVALWRAQQHRAVLLLGSATPSLESYCLAEKGDYVLSRLPNRIHDRPLPPVEIVDLRREMKEGHRSVFSRALLAALANTQAAGRQAIILLNRRGYATFVLCRECGFVLRCPACQLALKFHVTDEQLRCHYCEHQEPYPLVCPACAGRYIRHFGTGTQRVVEELQKHFPSLRLARLDADATARKGAHRQILASFRRGEYQVLVGTQMVAKGLDFPNVTLVGVITADTALNLPDFRAGERTFQLLTQVAGRAGRGEAGGRVIIQTYAPDHYAVQAAKTHDFEGFYRQELAARQELEYPPFSRLVRFVISGGKEEDVIRAAEFLPDILEPQVDALGPSPCPLAKLRGQFRWQVVARGFELETLLSVSKEAVALFRDNPLAGEVRLTVDVDPQNLL